MRTDDEHFKRVGLSATRSTSWQLERAADLAAAAHDWPLAERLAWLAHEMRTTRGPAVRA